MRVEFFFHSHMLDQGYKELKKKSRPPSAFKGANSFPRYKMTFVVPQIKSRENFFCLIANGENASSDTIVKGGEGCFPTREHFPHLTKHKSKGIL